MDKSDFIEELSKMTPIEINEYIKRNGKEGKSIIPYTFIINDENKLLDY